MKKILTLLACFTLALTAVAQGEMDEIEDNSDYEARFTRLNRAYAKSPDDVEALFNMAQFYFDNSHPMRNLPMAMKYIQRAEAKHIQLLENDKLGEVTRLARKNIAIVAREEGTIDDEIKMLTDAKLKKLRSEQKR